MTPTPRPTPRPTAGVGHPHARPKPNPTPTPTPNPTGTPTTPGRRPTKPAGWVYLVHSVDDPTKYVGQTRQPVPTRINRHRRPLAQGGQTWGHTILPGRRGYTILRRVESLGDQALDAIALDLAEAEAIAEWDPTENTHRPNPQVFRDRLATAQQTAGSTPTTPPRRGPTRPAPAPARRPTTGPPRTPTRGPRTIPAVGWLRVGLAAVWGFVALRATVGVGPDWLPWALTPVAVLLGPIAVIAWVRRYVLRPAKPRRRRRTGRARRRR